MVGIRYGLAYVDEGILARHHSSEIENAIERIIHPPDYYIHLFSLRPMEAQAEVKNNRIWANSMALKALHEVSIA